METKEYIGLSEAMSFNSVSIIGTFVLDPPSGILHHIMMASTKKAMEKLLSYDNVLKYEEFPDFEKYVLVIQEW